MNIAFVLLPSFNPDKPPLSLAYLKSYNSNLNVNIRCFDFNIDLYSKVDAKDKALWSCENFMLWENDNDFNKLSIIDDNLIDDWINEIMKIDPAIIGFSTYGTNMRLTVRVGEKIRRLSKDIFILLGGPDVFTHRNNFEIPYLKFADAIVLGEGEDITKKIIESIEKNGFITPMPGVLTKIGNCFAGEEKAGLIEDLDSMPFPDYEDFEFKKYKEPGQVPLLFSRGCTNKCRFCFETMFWQKFRIRSVNNILEEINQILVKYDGKKFNFSLNDSLINGDFALLDEFCNRVINKNMNIGWWGMARIDKRMDKKFVSKMVKAGCRSLSYGVESGSQKVLDLMHKQYQVNDIEKCIKDTFNAGIKPGVSLVVGFPGESEDDFNETVEIIKRTGKYIAYVNISSMCIIPCTFIDRDQYNIGIIKNTSMDWADLDGKNTFAIRSNRMNRLTAVVNEYVGKAVSFK